MLHRIRYHVYFVYIIDLFLVNSEALQTYRKSSGEFAVKLLLSVSSATIGFGRGSLEMSAQRLGLFQDTSLHMFVCQYNLRKIFNKQTVSWTTSMICMNIC